MNNNLINNFNNRIQPPAIPMMNNMNNPQMHQTMNNLRRMYQASTISKINDLEKQRGRLKVNPDQLRDAIIRPIKVEKSDKHEIVTKFSNLDKNFVKELSDLWSKRTNQPYKNILKNEDYKKDFKKKEDLIVHRVTKADRDEVKLKQDINKYSKDLETQNKELKIIYSQTNETEHKKKFEYNNKYKYRVKYDPKDYNELKEENLDYYKQEQMRLEKDKKKVDDVIENLLNTDLLTNDEKNELSGLVSFSKEKEASDKTEIKPIETNKEEKKTIKIKSRKIEEDELEMATLDDILKEDANLDKKKEDLKAKYANRKK